MNSAKSACSASAETDLLSAFFLILITVDTADVQFSIVNSKCMPN